MRQIPICALLLFGLSGAAPEPEYALPLGDKLHALNRVGALLEIESSVSGTDRLSVAALEPHILRVEVLKAQDDHTLNPAPASADVDIPLADTRSGDSQSLGGTPANSATTQSAQPSLDDLCNALFTSAQNNDLPVPFFANLLWQESRLRADDVSKKGAQGIAQFMPEAAAESGLADPFDPMQAIPASARLLQKLRLQFGNLGFVAAAYNAGAHRVIEWLEHRASLPRETRVYVVRVTGLSAETWRSMPIDNDALAFVQHLPCRRLPAFADVEQQILQRQPEQQMAQAQLDQAKAEQDERDEATEKTATASAPAHPARKSAAEDEHASEIKHTAEAKHAEENKRAAEGKHAGESKRVEESKRATEGKHADASKQAAEDKHERARDEARGTAHDDRHPAKSEASHAPHGAREKHRSA
jgi:Transglycosylase SLT domain